jgi:hypothetical protein
LIAGLGSLLTVLRDADPADNATIYHGLGPRLTYQPGQKNVIAEAKPTAIMYEGLCPRGDSAPELQHARKAQVCMRGN